MVRVLGNKPCLVFRRDVLKQQAGILNGAEVVVRSVNDERGLGDLARRLGGLNVGDPKAGEALAFGQHPVGVRPEAGLAEAMNSAAL